MPVPVPASRRHLRMLALAVAGVAALALLALAIHVQRLLQPERFTTLLENNLAAAGLKLRLQAPAEPMLFPHPGVQLEGFSLSSAGADSPVLQASGATVVVPWRALLRGDAAIERIEISAPRIDLDRLRALLARLPHHAGPPRLPTIATGISMSHGALLRSGVPVLFDLTIATGALAPDQAFGLAAAARDRSGRRYNATLATVPASHDDTIQLRSLQFTLVAHDGPQLRLAGHGSWRGGERVALQLHGTLAHAALTAPVSDAGMPSSARSIATPDARAATDTLALAVSPAKGTTPLAISLKLDGDDAHVDLTLRPTELARWWQQLLAATPGQPAVTLPFTGTANVRAIDLGWLKASGLEIKADPDLAPAPSASASPAASASIAR